MEFVCGRIGLALATPWFYRHRQPSEWKDARSGLFNYRSISVYFRSHRCDPSNIDSQLFSPPSRIMKGQCSIVATISAPRPSDARNAEQFHPRLKAHYGNDAAELRSPPVPQDGIAGADIASAEVAGRSVKADVWPSSNADWEHQREVSVSPGDCQGLCAVPWAGSIG